MAGTAWVSIALAAVAAVSLLDAVRLLWQAKRKAASSVGGMAELPDDLLPYLTVGASQDAAKAPGPEPAPAATAEPAGSGPALASPSGTGQVVIITHTDFDGMTSGALLLRAVGHDAALRFSSSRLLHVALESVAARLNGGDRVYVADLALEPDRLEEFQRIFRLVEQRGGEVHWFDHHVWSDEARRLADQSCRLFALDPKQSTAARMIRDRLLPDDQHADNILRLVSRGAGADDRWLQDWTHLLSETGRMGVQPETRARIVQKLANNEELSVSERWMIRRGRRRQQLTAAMTGDRHRQETTTAGRRMLVIDARPFRLERLADGRRLFVLGQPPPEITVARAACERWDAHFALVLWSNTRCSLSRGTDPTVDFRWLFGEKTLNGAPLTVRGHAYAAGVYLPLSARSALRQLADWRPPAEAEDFIGMLKERL